MSRSYFHLITGLAISVLGVMYLFFLNVTREHYSTNPPQIKSKHLYLRIKTVGTVQDTIGRFGKKKTAPFSVEIKFDSDIDYFAVEIKKLTLVTNSDGKEYNFLSENIEENKASFEDLQVGAKGIYTSPMALPIEFDLNETIEGKIIFEARIAGTIEMHDLDFTLTPKISYERRLLFPEEARALLLSNKY